MDFNLSKEELLVQQMYRAFAENEVKPLAGEVDEEERFPVETVQKMSKLGMMGTYLPKEYGGQGASYLSYVMAVEEMSKVCGTTGVIISAHTSLCANPIYDFGTEEQKKKYLPKLCSGEWIGAFGLTEPGAGTDAGGVKTMAVLDESGENYILNGSKIFITNAGYADVFIIIAMTDRTKGQRGLTAFIVERTFPGFSVGKHEKKMGIRGSSTCELIMENCIVPKANMLGKENKGFNLAMATLNGGRIGIAAQALGLAEGALEETIKYVKERKQFGKSIFKQQNTQFQLADMAAQVEAAKWMVYKAAMTKQKLIAAETAMSVTTKCVQLFGGYGYTRDYPVERMMRDAKITEIYEGTSEVQRMVIAGSL
jgi:butyryl-CoA dehydrogenase